MIVRTDAENLEWWKRLSKFDKAEIIGRMLDTCDSEGGQSFARNMSEKLNRNENFTVNQIIAIRKWSYD